MTKLKHSYTVLIEQTHFDSIEMKKAETIILEFYPLCFCSKVHITLIYSYFGEGGFYSSYNSCMENKETNPTKQTKNV